MKQKQPVWDKRRYDAAVSYALAERSDPFAAARIMAHMRNGVCGFTPQGKDAFYQADPATEDRVTALGVEYKAIVYRNLVRP